ncbi:hypothetical protein MKX03_008610, partial [Papaver bracteatum]
MDDFNMTTTATAATKNQEVQYEHSLDVTPPLQGGSKSFDDDGRLKRTGTVWTATTHIITAVIGSGVLSLAWAIAQLGWIGGPAVLFVFAFVIYYTSCLLADCYRSGDQVTGKRNYTYMDAVSTNLGGSKVKLCGLIYCIYCIYWQEKLYVHGCPSSYLV